MNLSQIFYEAACNGTSDVSPGSCFRVCDAAPDDGQYDGYQAAIEYAHLMSEIEGDIIGARSVVDAAAEVNWQTEDYRTFLLLMASEAVK